MTQITIEEIEKLEERRDEINNIPFEEIVFTKDSKPIEIPQKVKDAFRFVGLSNIWFVRWKLHEKTRRRIVRI